MPRPVYGHNHSPHKRTKIVTAYFLGHTAAEVGELEGLTEDAVRGVVKRYRRQESAKDNPRSGRPKKLNDRHKRRIFRCIEIDPFISNRELIEQCALPCSVTTLTRTLRQEGIQHSRALRRPKLTPEIARKRLEFARMHVRKPLLWWKRWIFSDEVTVARGDGERQKWVFCRKGERLYPRNVQPRSKPTRHSQMFWGAICGLRKSFIQPLNGHPDSPRQGVNAVRIRECLEANLPTIARRGNIFVHDNARTFTAYIVQDWLREWCSEHGVTLVDWPPYSPDLNPIENVWHIIKERIITAHPELSDMPKTPASLEFLCEAADRAWESLEPEVLANLYKSMRKRLQAVIDAEGWYTKY